MARTPNPYKKLPGRGMRRVFFGVRSARTRLWEGPDHLLLVDFTVMSEEYRRFYFRDIESFNIRRTPFRQVWNWVFGFFLLVTAGPFFLAWRSEGDGGLAIASISAAIFWSVMILVNSLRGSTCRTFIRTAAQTEELPSLGRVPVARKVLARLRPMIVAAQGVATPEEMADAPWMASDGVKIPGVSGPKPIRPDKGRLHGSLFGLLILEAILTAVAFLFFHEAISTLSLLSMFVGCIVCIIALVRQGDTDLPSSVRTLAKVSLAYYLLKCLAGYVFTVMFAVNHRGQPVLTGLEMVDEPGFGAASAISAGVAALVGIMGVVALLDFLNRRSNRQTA